MAEFALHFAHGCVQFLAHLFKVVVREVEILVEDFDARLDFVVQSFLALGDHFRDVHSEDVELRFHHLQHCIQIVLILGVAHCKLVLRQCSCSTVCFKLGDPLINFEVLSLVCFFKICDGS